MPYATVNGIELLGAFIDDLIREAASYDPRGTVGELAVPAVFLHGRLDEQIPPDVPRALAARAPRGQFRVIEGAGHMAHQEQPGEFNKALRAALCRMALLPVCGSDVAPVG